MEKNKGSCQNRERGNHPSIPPSRIVINGKISLKAIGTVIRIRESINASIYVFDYFSKYMSAFKKGIKAATRPWM